MPNFYPHISAEQSTRLISSVSRGYDQHTGRIRHLHAHAQTKCQHWSPYMSWAHAALPAPMRCDQESCNSPAHPSGPQLLLRNRKDCNEKGGNQFVGCCPQNKGENRNLWSKSFPVRVCKTGAHFQTEKNEILGVFFFKHIVLDEAWIAGPHPQKHKNNVEFFQLLPYNPKGAPLGAQSDTSMVWRGKEDVVMHLAHAQQTQSNSGLGKLSFRS